MPDETTEKAMALFTRGERFHKFKEMSAAKEALRESIELNDSYAPAWDLLGRVYDAIEDSEQAIECFKKAADTDSKWHLPMAHLGILLYSLERTQEAVDALKSYVDRGGDDNNILLILARAAYEVGDCEIVMTLTAMINKVDDDLYESWELRGLCQASQSKFNAACVSLSVAIELHPESKNSLNAVGDICYEAGNYERAVEFYKVSLAVDDTQADVLFRHGTSLWLLERWSESLPILEKYTELSPDDPKGWNNLGVVLREKGEVKRAIECYSRALSLDPDLEIVKKNLETAKDMQVII